MARVLRIGEATYQAAGGNGGDGGGAGGFVDSKPAKGANGAGCRYGDGGDGGRGAVVPASPGRTVSDGGNGGKGYPGETLVVELEDLSLGDTFHVTVGGGGGGGGGGEGYENGGIGAKGINGSVIFVPIFEVQGAN